MFIKLGTEDGEIHCFKEGGVAADTREAIQRDAVHACHCNGYQTPSRMLERTKMSWRRTNMFNKTANPLY